MKVELNRSLLPNVPFAFPLPVTLLARTVPPLRKTDNPFVGRVVKLARVKGILGGDYRAELRKAMGLAPDAPLPESARVWGETVNPGLLRLGASLYFRLIEHSRQERWYLDGKIVDPALFAPWLPVPDQAGPVKYRTFAAASVLSLHVRDHSYRLV